MVGRIRGLLPIVLCHLSKTTRWSGNVERVQWEERSTAYDLPLRGPRYQRVINNIGRILSKRNYLFGVFGIDLTLFRIDRDQGGHKTQP